eukprot:1148208-Pelagomonas_calceolata.AAC.6
MSLPKAVQAKGAIGLSAHAGQECHWIECTRRHQVQNSCLVIMQARNATCKRACHKRVITNLPNISQMPINSSQECLRGGRHHLGCSMDTVKSALVEAGTLDRLVDALEGDSNNWSRLPLWRRTPWAAWWTQSRGMKRSVYD